MISFVHLLVVGMFNVLSALGGGGQVDPTTSNNANTILYSLFCAFALFSGSVCNYLGPKVTLATGGIGYSLLSASYWSYNNNKNEAFVYFGGAMCGVAAAFLWTAEGSMIMSLPMEHEKGRYVGIFYGISFFGTVIGAIIPTVENWGVTTAGSVNDSTYIALFALMLMGSVLACFVSNPSKVIRADGSRVVVPRQTTFIQELKNVVLVVRKEPWIMLFFPYSFAGLWYIPYQSNDFNAYFFDLRTRAFGSLWFDFGQFSMAVVVGALLDLKALGNRRRRAFIGWGFLFILINAVFIGGVFPARRSQRGEPPSPLIDVNDSEAAGYIVLYTFYGAVDGAWQTFAWWIMGTLSNDPLVLSIYSAFYKVFGAMGAAIVFSLDVKKTSYRAMFGSYWSLLAGSMVLVLVLIYKRVQDSLIDLDLAQSKETETKDIIE
ncbi:uncharacterized protein N7443_008209 [Penicillium atrosanguineum]|uniref:UNC93-like protein n=1 Tax=Penicillium atrosanguineum TaxID=1132637 RepID=A0A9W9PS79_9EURO|nr:uncharacterized protein N7443_008209 [Penicillium atrosanguineum]KAJ5292256.1 hypothetical protein N7443_008209 [Penicillium atrosanguineum]KAJ5303724.1 hypothetical protein N7476_010523 [Penicillium atrosanguineum]